MPSSTFLLLSLVRMLCHLCLIGFSSRYKTWLARHAAQYSCSIARSQAANHHVQVSEANNRVQSCLTNQQQWCLRRKKVCIFAHRIGVHCSVNRYCWVASCVTAAHW